jgi:hypothetical protein
LFGSGLDPATPGLKVSATGSEAYLQFVPQTVGISSAAANVTITNTGSAPLLVTSATITDGAADFTVTHSCTSIAAGASCVAAVTFTPITASLRTGRFTIVTNAPIVGTQIVSLEGTGSGGGVTPTAPGAPTLQSIVPGNGQVTVNFTAPASNGGSAITGYTVTCNPGGITASGMTSPMVVTGLTNGTAATCSLTARNAIGSGLASSTATTTPSLNPAPVLVSAFSRKFHGGLGPFDLELGITESISQQVTVEPRSVGSGHVIVFRFNQSIVEAGTATVVDAAPANIGSIASVSVQNNTDVVVTLAGIPDSQRVTVTLGNVNNAGGSYPVSMGFLVGDVTGNRSVNAGDISAIKARINQTLGPNNFRFDLNTSGAIDGRDVSMVKARAGWVLP